MKKSIKYIILITICISSFYITEKIALYVKMRNPLIRDINSIKKEKNTDFTNCVFIDDKYIIPGLNGREINIDSSFRKMKKNNLFDEELLVYNQIVPEESIENNKNRIIIRGNSKKNNVSLLFTDDTQLTKYMLKQNYIVNLLTDKEINNYDYEYVNNAHSKDMYNKIEKNLKQHKINNNLCYVQYDKTSPYCKDKYLFKESLIINHSNISENIKKIRAGEIIKIENTISVKELEIILNQIKYQSLNIVPISELISETN